MPSRHALKLRLRELMGQETGTSSAGYPYLKRHVWERFRDTIPHLFGAGLLTLELATEVRDEDPDAYSAAFRVVRQVVYTATITAPPDLWLLRYVLGSFAEVGLLERLVAGEAIYPESGVAGEVRLDARELDIDLHFLLSRGMVEQYDNSFRIAGHPEVRRIFDTIRPVAIAPETSPTHLWRAYFEGRGLAPEDRALLIALGDEVPVREDFSQNHWVPQLEEIELGFRLVPLVLGLRAAGAMSRAPELDLDDPVQGAAAAILEAAAWLRDGEWTATGQRGASRGPGPLGIIETYHPYVANGARLLVGQEGEFWVERAENVGASQDANSKTFERANDALDRFCAETGFAYDVFVEHAIGKGEATRQRRERSGDDLHYFGADLEDAAIDAAMAEQARGVLPEAMRFVRNADIGAPAVLVSAIEEAGLETHGAVMLVGNGFHEVRGQTNARMVEVFRGYHDAGIILVFTEENALAIDDLRATAFNTYHAGFKYVHEKSGQGLRPADPRPVPRLGQPLRAPWSECARQAGYVPLEAYGYRSRTVYPYTPPSGHNPSISVTHFVVPGHIARELGLDDGSA